MGHVGKTVTQNVVSGSEITDGTVTGADLASDIAISTSGAISGGTLTVSGDVAIDTDTLFVDVSQDNVGINTNAVDSDVALEVNGNVAFKNGSNYSLYADVDGALTAYHNGSAKFATTTNGIVVGGITAETHNSSMKTVQVGARGFLTPFDSGATYLTSNVFYNASSSWEYATAGGGNVLSLNNGSFYVYHCQNGSDGGTPTLIERMNIYNNNSNNDNYNLIYATRNSVATYVINKHSSAPYGLYIEFDSAAPDNNDQYFLRCHDNSGANRMTVFSDGDVNTSDAGTLTSDIKNKNTITDATSKYDDVKKLQVRNFYWNEDYHPNKKDKKMIGFIAQEFETVFPGLVTEMKDEKPVTEKDEDGNDTKIHKDLGTTTKVIKEGKLIPILTKALQECMAKIETLETKVKALEEA